MQLELIQADITSLEVDAIVNAANNSLAGGGGVDGAIHRAAGPALLKACRQIGTCPTGESRITPGFNLPARYVIHTVGPVWKGGCHGEPELLRACYRSALALAAGYACDGLAFPAISCGVYGYPVEQAARIAVDEVLGFASVNTIPSRVFLVCFGQPVLDAYTRALADYRAG